MTAAVGAAATATYYWHCDDRPAAHGMLVVPVALLLCGNFQPSELDFASGAQNIGKRDGHRRRSGWAAGLHVLLVLLDR